jgi:hypothetical protein
MTDLTKITTPFGLLDEATKKALRAAGEPYQRYIWEQWEDCGRSPTFYPDMTYRLKPQPPKPREFWLNLYGKCKVGSYYSTKEDADYFATPDRVACIQVREVLE